LIAVWVQVLSVLGLGIACGAWILFQRWIARKDPGQPGVERSCGTCGKAGACDPHTISDADCTRERTPRTEPHLV
jgi:hypothetical protein